MAIAEGYKEAKAKRIPLCQFYSITRHYSTFLKLYNELKTLVSRYGQSVQNLAICIVVNHIDGAVIRMYISITYRDKNTDDTHCQMQPFHEIIAGKNIITICSPKVIAGSSYFGI